MNETEEEKNIPESFEAFVDVVYSITDELAKIGYPIPKENNKSFYLKCCWVLGWLNKAQKTNDENILIFRKTLKDLLPIMREIKV